MSEIKEPNIEPFALSSSLDLYRTLGLGIISSAKSRHHFSDHFVLEKGHPQRTRGQRQRQSSQQEWASTAYKTASLFEPIRHQQLVRAQFAYTKEQRLGAVAVNEGSSRNIGTTIFLS